MKRLPCSTQNDHNGQTKFKICPFLKWTQLKINDKLSMMTQIPIIKNITLNIKNTFNYLFRAKNTIISI